MKTTTPEMIDFQRRVAEGKYVGQDITQAMKDEGLLSQDFKPVDLRVDSGAVKGMTPAGGNLANGPISGKALKGADFSSTNFGLPRAMAALDRNRTYGVGKLTASREATESRSKTDRFANGEPYEELPLGPGFNYMTHLFKRHNIEDKIKAQKAMGDDKPKIFTEEMEAVKAALAAMGIYGDKNPGGLPMDIKEAKAIWFGDEALDEVKEAEWRQMIELGDTKIDPKRVRKFVNYDGSLTWELLNQDKTVMSRFTLGEYNGTKIFSQGGYKKFAEVLNKAKQRLGPNIQGRFDAIRGMFGG